MGMVFFTKEVTVELKTHLLVCQTAAVLKPVAHQLAHRVLGKIIKISYTQCILSTYEQKINLT